MLIQLIQGGVIVNPPSEIPAVSAATTKFQTEVKDPKAAVISGFNFVSEFQQVNSLGYLHRNQLLTVRLI